MDRIKFAFKRVNSPVACCALSAKVGTRDEEPQFGGLAHLNEHMLFKGTQKRGSTGINNILENVGGELNAYTTKEETVIHATVLKGDLRKAVDLLFELAFTSIYPQKELIKEKEVVYEEIISYKDSKVNKNAITKVEVKKSEEQDVKELTKQIDFYIYNQTYYLIHI